MHKILKSACSAFVIGCATCIGFGVVTFTYGAYGMRAETSTGTGYVVELDNATIEETINLTLTDEEMSIIEEAINLTLTDKEMSIISFMDKKFDSKVGNVLFAKFKDAGCVVLQSGLSRRTQADELAKVALEEQPAVLIGIDVVLGFSSLIDPQRKKELSKKLQNLGAEQVIEHGQTFSREEMNEFLTSLTEYCKTVQEVVVMKEQSEKSYVCSKSGHDNASQLLQTMQTLDDSKMKSSLDILMSSMNIAQLDKDTVGLCAQGLSSNTDIEVDACSIALKWLRRAFHTEVQLAVYEKHTNQQVEKIISTFAPCLSCEHIDQINKWNKNGAFFVCVKKDSDKHSTEPLRLLHFGRVWELAWKYRKPGTEYQEQQSQLAKRQGLHLYIAYPTK